MITYEEPAYAAERLTGTIVRHADKAVKVDGLMDVENVAVSYITRGGRATVKLKELDITPVPLGFCNYNGSVTYLSRSPVRNDWKQGLRNKTLRSSSPRWGVDEIPFKAIGTTIDGLFPSLERAFANVKDRELEAMAWCRDFAIDNNLNIFYKTVGVVGAFLDTTERRFHLEKPFRWVQESLEEVLHA